MCTCVMLCSVLFCCFTWTSLQAVMELDAHKVGPVKCVRLHPDHKRLLSVSLGPQTPVSFERKPCRAGLQPIFSACAEMNTHG